MRNKWFVDNILYSVKRRLWKNVSVCHYSVSVRAQHSFTCLNFSNLILLGLYCWPYSLHQQGSYIHFILLYTLSMERTPLRLTGLANSLNTATFDQIKSKPGSLIKYKGVGSCLCVYAYGFSIPIPYTSGWVSVPGWWCLCVWLQVQAWFSLCVYACLNVCVCVFINGC